MYHFAHQSKILIIGKIEGSGGQYMGTHIFYKPKTALKK